MDGSWPWPALVEGMRNSRATVMLAPLDPDEHIARTLGLALLLDKPLIVVLLPGRTIPARLDSIAAAVVDYVEPIDDPANLAALERAIRGVQEELEQ